MRVLIDARVRPGEQGGVQQAILGLGTGLARLEGPDVYLFLVEGDGSWLAPYLDGPCHLLPAAFPTGAAAAVLARAGRGRTAARYLLETRGRVLPRVDPAADAARPDLVHFMRHRGWRTRLPSIYVNHDLQHVALPELFSPVTRAYRSAVYGAMARQASRIAVMSSADVVPTAAHYGVPPDRMLVVPWASVLASYPADPGALPDVPGRFALYPARSWPHKNHVGLVRALAVLRDRGLGVDVVLTGSQDAHWPSVVALAQELGVSDRLHHLGHVSDAALRALYARAALLVFPSRYEGFGLPLVEAFEAGTPVACGDVPPLREIASGAARLFDPDDPASIAEAVAAVWADAGLAGSLAARGAERLAAFSWERTARLYRAHYRTLLHEASPDDRALLAEAPVV